MKPIFALLLLSLAVRTAAAAEEPDFLLRDGDTVVFVGDSITAAQTYGKLVETYTLLRFPDRQIRFFNAGKGGDTAEGALARLDRDVFPLKPTVVMLACGVNDIGWGFKADAAQKQKHLEAVRKIILACQAKEVRFFLCSPAITADAPEKAENGFLQAMADEAHTIAASMGATAVDVQRPMREIQRRILEANAKSTESAAEAASLHAADGVHLNDLGHLAMAFAILKGLNAPAEVSSARLQAGETLEIPEASHCAITDYVRDGDGIAFTRLDERLPFYVSPLYGLNYGWVPVPSELNQYQLAVQGLKAGWYRLEVDRRSIGRYTAEQLSRGVNLSTATLDGWHPGGPWAIQAHLLHSLTEARNKLGIAGFQRGLYESEGPLGSFTADDFLAANSALEGLQRETAKPRPYRFRLTPVTVGEEDAAE